MPENNHFKISEIISRHLGGDISPWEKEFLDSWLSESAHHRELFAKWTNQHTLTEKKNAYERIKIEPAWEKFNAIRQKVVRRKRQIRRLRLSRYAAILLFPLTVSWFIWQENRTIHPPVSNPPIQAGQPQARLTLSNGRQFILDNQNRQIEDGDNTIPADSGKINYTLAKIPSPEPGNLSHTGYSPGRRIFHHTGRRDKSMAERRKPVKISGRILQRNQRSIPHRRSIFQSNLRYIPSIYCHHRPGQNHRLRHLLQCQLLSGRPDNAHNPRRRESSGKSHPQRRKHANAGRRTDTPGKKRQNEQRKNRRHTLHLLEIRTVCIQRHAPG